MLTAYGTDLSGVSSYAESGLRVLSRIGRFDGVRLLLDAGADCSQLAWTPLMKAVALGSLDDVQVALEQGAALEERDWWERTAWLISLLTGDIAKAGLLRKWGADPAARGRCGCPPLFYAIQGHHPDMLRWLLGQGPDVHQVDEFGTTALIEAVDAEDLECVEILLSAGADVGVDANGTALSRAGSRDIILRLLDAGADPSGRQPASAPGPPASAEEALAGITPDEFRRTYTRRFGTENPERMRVPFWEAMIRCGVSAYGARYRSGWPKRSRARPPRPVHPGSGAPARFAEPVWCADRFGQSLTLLPDSRAVQIGGEHEDFYDPDFCIYNDVFVHERDGSVTIYCYPEPVFPPTDFHTATLVGDSIYVVGCLGYSETRCPDETPVYRLNIHTFRIDRLHTHGEAPGRIYKHRAVAVPPHGIRVWGGEVVIECDGRESHQQTSAPCSTWTAYRTASQLRRRRRRNEE